MSSWRLEWVNKKLSIAEKLNEGECDGTYAEAILIICSILSAMASEVWPGKGFDPKRFVELLVHYSDPDLKVTRISVPLLKEQYNSSTTSNIQLSLGPGEIVTAKDVDLSENEVIRKCPDITLANIREFSYPNILYKELRCSYAHEYKPGGKADSWSMGIRGNDVSYTNNGPNGAGKYRKLIYFYINWLVKVTRSIAKNLDTNSTAFPSNKPQKWWVDG